MAIHDLPNHFLNFLQTLNFNEFNNSIYNKMENTNQTIQPNDKKSTNDFVKLVIGIFVFILILVALKYLVSALGII